MPGIIDQLPENFPFKAEIPIRITDINYGNHVGNDSVLSLLHEARVQYLASLGYGELDMEGIGIIMKDAVIEFKNEILYGDRIIAFVAAANFTRISFDLFYKLEKISGDKNIPVVAARTCMICYNYDTKKISSVPEMVRKKLSGQGEK